MKFISMNLWVYIVLNRSVRFSFLLDKIENGILCEQLFWAEDWVARIEVGTEIEDFNFKRHLASLPENHPPISMYKNFHQFMMSFTSLT